MQLRMQCSRRFFDSTAI